MSKSFLEIHFTGEGFRTLSTYRRFFAAALAEVRKREADYDEEVRAWYEEGEGRPRSEGGSGYRFPHCIHGASLWTDYDNICGWCEDSSTAIEQAIVFGRERFLRFVQRWEWVNAAPGDLDYDTRKGLLHWAASLHPGLEHLAKEA